MNFRPKRTPGRDMTLGLVQHKCMRYWSASFRSTMETPDHLHHDLRMRSTDKRMTDCSRTSKFARVHTQQFGSSLGVSFSVSTENSDRHYLLRASSSHYLSKCHILLPGQFFPLNKPAFILSSLFLKRKFSSLVESSVSSPLCQLSRFF